MLKQIEEYIKEVEEFITDSAEDAEQFRIKYLGKKGVLNQLFAAFKDVPNEEKKAFGKTLNELKTKAQEKVASLKKKFSRTRGSNFERNRPNNEC